MYCPGMGGCFHPERVDVFDRNGWMDCSEIRTTAVDSGTAPAAPWSNPRTPSNQPLPRTPKRYSQLNRGHLFGAVDALSGLASVFGLRANGIVFRVAALREYAYQRRRTERNLGQRICSPVCAFAAERRLHTKTSTTQLVRGAL
jgi:hypothetical protein